jgi:septal ring factor EnvC (AmiA/AmiB activator)
MEVVEYTNQQADLRKYGGVYVNNPNYGMEVYIKEVLEIAIKRKAEEKAEFSRLMSYISASIRKGSNEDFNIQMEKLENLNDRAALTYEKLVDEIKECQKIMEERKEKD